MEGEGDTMSPLPAPRPRVFPVSGISSTPRCGHTLTALAGPEGDLQGARLVLFGELSCVTHTEQEPTYHDVSTLLHALHDLLSFLVHPSLWPS